MPRLVFTDRAQEDLLDAWLYIADEDLATADRVVETIDQESRTREDQPWIGRIKSSFFAKFQKEKNYFPK